MNAELRERVARVLAIIGKPTTADYAITDAILAIVRADEAAIRADERAKVREQATSDEAVERACRAYLRSMDIDPDMPRGGGATAPIWWKTEVPFIRAAILAADGR